MIKKAANKAVKKVTHYYVNKPLLFLAILLVFILFMDLILALTTKKTKVITLKIKDSSNMIGRYRQPTMNYNIVDENGENYNYDYQWLLQTTGLQKGRFREFLDLNLNEKYQITYYGIFSHSILDIQKAA